MSSSFLHAQPFGMVSSHHVPTATNTTGTSVPATMRHAMPHLATAQWTTKCSLQAGTSHNLGDNFAKVFNTTFLNEGNVERHVHQSSWGMSTRMVGGVIMTHGDDAGLRLPPHLAPTQVVIVPVIPKEKERVAVEAQVAGMQSALEEAGVRVKVDASDRSPGWKFNFWEMKGVPLRLEVGPKDVEKCACVLARRDKPGKDGKEFGVSVEAVAMVARVRAVLASVQVHSFHCPRSLRRQIS
jgi:prolyl-tRNA synthetase